MNAKVADLMTRELITAQPHHSIVHVRELMRTHRLHAVPVLGPEGEVRGIVSSRDLSDSLKDHAPISQIMVQDVYTIPQYNDVHHAARLMRNHRIHHVVVTHDQKVVGMISSFDLLALVEDHRFVMKPSPSSGKRAPKRR